MLFLALECETRKPLLHANQEEQLTAADAASAEGICTVTFSSAGSELPSMEHGTPGPQRNDGSTQRTLHLQPNEAESTSPLRKASCHEAVLKWDRSYLTSHCFKFKDFSLRGVGGTVGLLFRAVVFVSVNINC